LKIRHDVPSVINVRLAGDPVCWADMWGQVVARGLNEGDTVYVPRARLGLDADNPSALWKTTVRRVVNRSLVVDLPNGELSEPVASSAAHLNVGTLIFRVGDFDTERTLLDPLAKSILQFCKLLLPDDQVLLREVRSRAELSRFWQQDHPTHSHVVLIGHGRKDGIRFGQDDWVTADDLAEVLGGADVSAKVLISMCCKNGYANFGQALSKKAICQAAIGPFDAVHGAVASQFLQTFLGYLFLEGETLKVAFRHARVRVAGATSFRLWIAGKLTADSR
jgi:hypothetical protein